jgi:hypothetical protein
MWRLLWRLFLDRLLQWRIYERFHTEHDGYNGEHRDDRGADDVGHHHGEHPFDGHLFHEHVHDDQPPAERCAPGLRC